MYSRYKFFVRYMICKCPPIPWIVFSFLNGVLWSTKILKIWWSSVYLLFICCSCFQHHIEESPTQSKVMTVSSKSFIVSALICFELTFVYGMRETFFFLFACGSPVVTAPFVERLVLHWMVLALWKLVDYRCLHLVLVLASHLKVSWS